MGSTPFETTFTIHVRLGDELYEFNCRASHAVRTPVNSAGLTLLNSRGVGMCTSCVAYYSDYIIEIGY